MNAGPAGDGSEGAAPQDSAAEESAAEDGPGESLELTRNLSHYLGPGATQRYPEGELELASVPTWQSRHCADGVATDGAVGDLTAQVSACRLGEEDAATSKNGSSVEKAIEPTVEVVKGSISQRKLAKAKLCPAVESPKELELWTCLGALTQLDELSGEEGFVCETCNKPNVDGEEPATVCKTAALKQLRLHSAPAILTLHMKRSLTKQSYPLLRDSH